MTGKALLLILGSVGLSAFAQIALKIGMGGEAARDAMAHGSLVYGYIRLLVIPAVVCGLVAYGLSALLWLRVLAELDVSKAYPFVALGIVVTMTSGALFLGESVPLLRVAGAALVIVGVLLVGMS
ncbi:MAG: EamA family transporter [Burkholderiaceae bacterium]|nr:EamA family transporter [Burkholderiaceae bacterium]